MPEEKERQNKSRLQQARNKIAAAKNMAKNAAAAGSMINSLGKKISEHWYILVAALIFDAFGLVPVIGALANVFFGALLWLYFGSKKKAGTSELQKIVLPVFIGSIFDFFIGILPVNFGAALIRIALD